MVGIGGGGKISNLLVDANLAMGVHKITGGGVVKNAVGEFNDHPEMFDKVASDNLRHSDDVGASGTNTTYAVKETITFTNGIKGTLRIKMDIRRITGVTCYGKIQANGVDVGAEQSEAGAAFVTKSQDIAIDIGASETITLLTKGEGGDEAHAWEHFRIYYDNGADVVAVAVTGAD